MSDYDTRRATRYVPHVAVATTAVVVIPVGGVWWLRSRGAITSPWAGVILAMAISLAASWVGSAYWKRRRGPRDLLFGELLVWGWLRRVRMERHLARSMQLLRADDQLQGGGRDADRAFRILSQLAVALEAQDAYTDGHSRRVAAHAVIVARRLGLSSGEVSRVRAAAAVHDIGKVRVPLGVLDKPGRLTSNEFELVKRHADVGAELVACLGDPELTEIVRHHHEHFDGTGYPAGLAYERIPLGARIIAVADTFDALTSVRPYRPAASHKRALEALANASGTQLDPVAVRAFLRSYSGNKAIVFWSLLTVSPQRAVAWLGGKSRAPRNASLTPIAATVGAITAIAVTAITTPIGSRPGPYSARDVFRRAPRAVAAASLQPAVGTPRRGSHHPADRLTALPATRRGHAATGIGRVFGARAVPAGNTAAVHVDGHGLGRRSGSKPSGGSFRKHSGGSPGGPPGGSNGSAGSGPGAGARRGSSSGSASGGKGGSGAGTAGGSTRVTAGGSTGAQPGGSTGATAGGSTGATAGGSTGVTAGGSSGAAGSSSGSGAGLPSTKDQCKGSGYVQFGFANQGQCVAFVERGPR